MDQKRILIIFLMEISCGNNYYTNCPVIGRDVTLEHYKLRSSCTAHSKNGMCIGSVYWQEKIPTKYYLEFKCGKREVSSQTWTHPPDTQTHKH